MAWSGSCSEFEDDYAGADYWDDPGTDLEDLPDEELIIELRDEQNSIKEAQRLIHKEIKSIRRELKHLLRYHAATHPLQEHGDHRVDHHVDSGVGESNYNTASEIASSYGESEAGYQAFEYDTDASAVGYAHDRNRSHRFEDYEGRRQFHDEDPRNVLPSYKNRERLTRHEHEDGSLGGLGFGQNWEDGGTSLVLEEHVRGKRSTYEDAHNTMRRHEGDSQDMNSEPEGSGNWWKSTTKKHTKNILSVPEFDRGDSGMSHVSRKCTPDENVGDLLGFGDAGYGDRDRSKKHSESTDLNHNMKRRQFENTISESNDTYRDSETARSRGAGVKISQAMQHRLRHDNKKLAHCGVSQSAARDGSDPKSQPSSVCGGATISGEGSGRPPQSYCRSLESFSGIAHHSEQPYRDQDEARRLMKPKSSFGAVSSLRSSSDESRYERQEMRTNVRENKTRGYRR